MVRLNRIYTGTGDAGSTALGSGQRVLKTALRVEAYGTVDETNSILGLAALHAEGETAAAIARIQNDLFDLGADLACPPEEGQKTPGLRIVAAQPDRLEREIDSMNEHLQPLRSFVLPGGSPLAAAFHQARTVCRRAERRVFALAADEPVGAEALRYLNRLSDWFFVAARMANRDGADDVLWTPGENTGVERSG